MDGINISEDKTEPIFLTFPDYPLLVAEAKTILAYRWHHFENLWSFPNTDGMLEKILKVFGGKAI